MPDNLMLWAMRLSIFMLMYFGTGQLLEGGSYMVGIGLMAVAGVIGMVGIRRFGRL